MKIVIDIPKEKYDMIKNKMYCGIYDAELYKAIANGTPQPKMGKYKSAIRALFETYWYFDDGFLTKLRDDIYKAHLSGCETYVIEQFPDNGMDTLIYSWLIMMYGDYGTAPKVGWLDDLPGAIKWLDEFMGGVKWD